MKQILNEIINKGKSAKDDYIICIVTSVKSITKSYDYNHHSVSTSYLSLLELEEIVNYFRVNGFVVEIYYGVDDFFKKYYENTSREIIVFETSSKGISRGRDSLLPAFCDQNEIPHLSGDAYSSTICIGKYQWTSILEKNNILVPKSWKYTDGCWNKNLESLKYILKLNYECASIGLSKNSIIDQNIPLTTERAAELVQYNQPIIAQEFISGFEVEVPILVSKKHKLVFPAVGLKINNKEFLGDVFFDYDSIYYDEYTTYDFGLAKVQWTKKINSICTEIIDLLDLSGFMRIDFRIDLQGNPFVIDINNDPTINSGGSFIKSLEILGFCKDDIAPLLIGNALNKLVSP